MSVVELLEVSDRAQRPLSFEPRPFLRWAGSKRRLLTSIVPHLPASMGTYWEPFLGEDLSIFLELVARLNDRCVPLIQTFAAVRDGASSVGRRAASWAVDGKTYYRMRRMVPENRFERAAKFIYLNKTCWNGPIASTHKACSMFPLADQNHQCWDEPKLMACGKLIRTTDVALESKDLKRRWTRWPPGTSSTSIRPMLQVTITTALLTTTNISSPGTINGDWLPSLNGLCDVVRTVVVSNAFHSDIIDLYPSFDPFGFRATIDPGWKDGQAEQSNRSDIFGGPLSG